MQCPNCGAQIKRFELDQNCRHCGINIFYSQQEKLLSDDAKKCELEYASFRLLTARLKTAYIKGPLPILRIVFTLLCVAAVLVPFATLNVSVPLFEKSVSFGGIGLYQSFGDGTLAALFDCMDIELLKPVAVKSFLLIASMLLIVLAALAQVAVEFLSFINIRKSALAMAVASGFGIAASAFSVVCSFVFTGAADGFPSGAVGASFGFGGFVCAVMFAAMLFLNLTMLHKKIAPDYKEIDLKRVEVRRKLKRGEITLDELSLPVFSEEEASVQGGEVNV